MDDVPDTKVDCRSGLAPQISLDGQMGSSGALDICCRSDGCGSHNRLEGRLGGFPGVADSSLGGITVYQFLPEPESSL